MRPLLLTLSLFLLPRVYAQTCIHKDLSPTLTFITQTKRIKRPDNVFDSCNVTIKIIDKASKKTIQVISLETSDLYDGDYAKCRLVRSYSTGKNKHDTITDTDYGDMVIADLNFDQKEDIAVKSENGMAGTHYTFYVQGPDKQFRLDRFLTDSMQTFPFSFNKKRKTLTTLERAGVMCGEQVYRLDNKKNKWSMIRHRFLRSL
jgi:hypothetical protein